MATASRSKPTARCGRGAATTLASLATAPGHQAAARWRCPGSPAWWRWPQEADTASRSKPTARYNPASFQHHWTTDFNEYNVLGTLGWSKEGIDGYILPTSVAGTLPLYRLYLNVFGGLHLWTTDANERSVLTTSAGWADEGIAGYVVPLP